MGVLSCLLLTRAAAEHVESGEGSAAAPVKAVHDDEKEDEKPYQFRFMDRLHGQENEAASSNASGSEPEADDEKPDGDDDVEELLNLDQELIVLGH